VKWLIRIPIRVHCWGGLGSQFYALSTAFQIQELFPHRKIILSLHTGGVTKRVPEITSFLNGLFEIETIDDFIAPSKLESKNLGWNKRVKIGFRLFFKWVLIKSGIWAQANTEDEFKNIRPWLMSLRGHYFYRKIPAKFYNFFLDLLKDYREPKKTDEFILAIHYRMGDLLQLKEKTIFPVDKLITEVNKIAKAHPIMSVIVYSDSPLEARQVLEGAGLSKKFQVSDAPTLQVIGECLGVDFFIGTNSKVSLWIVNLRRYMGMAESSYIDGFEQQLYEVEGVKS
jgi:hypothetical protein